jgi:pantoate--beta-alanine ligase
VIRTFVEKRDLRAAIAGARRDGRSVGFVPTMGALHEGHLSLVRAARTRTDLVVVSIFVNPTQFGPSEDFERYPRRLEDDAERLGAEGVDLLFTPAEAEMYPAGQRMAIDPGALAERWEGTIRPTHFRGVATVVAKLFGIVRPDAAFFGEKDYQQLIVVRRMALDFELAVDVVACPTIRDVDGLALSSRNSYLSADQRQAALGLPAALAVAREAHAQGETRGAELEARMRAAAEPHSGAALQLEYAAVVDPDTLEPLPMVDRPARALIAGRVGQTRLIDNVALDNQSGGRA